MKNIVLTLFALCFSLQLSAQQITLHKSESAEKALSQIDKIRQPTEAMGYRIGIFFDNGQDARSKATEAKKAFEDSFPTQPVYMVYESPYYKVSAGNCLTEEEAIMLFERVRKVFPSAYVMREKMKITDFVNDNSALPTDEPQPAVRLSVDDEENNISQSDR
ncbi:MAG: hypothetical protein R3Y44_05775 [Rikenellaceae bacterium]